MNISSGRLNLLPQACTANEVDIYTNNRPVNDLQLGDLAKAAE
jgi:hypothetical protein